jgi:hypothetical protein
MCAACHAARTHRRAEQLETWRGGAGGGSGKGGSDHQGSDHLADDISSMRYVRLNMRDLANNAAHGMAASQPQAAANGSSAGGPAL